MSLIRNTKSVFLGSLNSALNTEGNRFFREVSLLPLPLCPLPVNMRVDKIHNLEILENCFQGYARLQFYFESEM